MAGVDTITSNSEQRCKCQPHMNLALHITAAPPVNFGIIVFPGFQALDAFGPLDILNTLARTFPASFTLSVIASSLDPVSTTPTHIPWANPTFGQTIVPTHTFDTAPPLDVLLIPGGLGNRDPGPGIQAVIEFTRKIYPSLKYLITVCTGAVLAARAGVLDGKRATTNKRAWKLTELRPEVEWVPQARWVVDGNIWTSSGVSAGMDVTFAFIGAVYGAEVAEEVANVLEYERHVDSSWDPFAGLAGLV
jgi:transcriptional regulator GlxA family with amidase domain